MNPTDDQYGSAVEQLLTQDLPLTGFTAFDAMLLVGILAIIAGLAIGLYATRPR